MGGPINLEKDPVRFRLENGELVTEPAFLPSPFPGNFTLKGTLRIEVDLVGGTVVFVIPDGFTTDFNSVPFYLRWLLPKTGKASIAALLHDYLYRTLTGIEKPLADAFYYRLMQFFRVSHWRAWTYYVGVVMFGGRTWRKEHFLAFESNRTAETWSREQEQRYKTF